MSFPRLIPFVLLALGLCSHLHAAAAPPNLAIFIADDVSAEDIGCYGNNGIRTPVIDRMAKEGMRFENAFLTCSSCSPSRCSLMTGRYPHSTGAQELHLPLPAAQVVFPELLKKAGYYTAAAGKWHMGPEPKRAFDVIKEGGKPSGCEFWMDLVTQRPKDKPFFLYFAAFDAHRDYEKGAIAKPHDPKDVTVPPYLPDTAETREDLALYYDEISRFDDYIGKVTDALRADGVLDNTLVLIMADNGRPFPRCKTTVLDSGVRTPFIVRWPGHVKAGALGKNLVSSVDIAPTFCEAAGAGTSSTFQGVSFLPQLADPSKSTREFVFAEHNWHDYQAHERSVSDGRYLFISNTLPQLMRTPPADAVRSVTFQKMIAMQRAGELQDYQRDVFTAPRPNEELYDRESDPHQLSNRAPDPALAAQAARLKAALAAWQKETADSVPEKPRADEYDRWTGEPLASGKGKSKAKVKTKKGAAKE